MSETSTLINAPEYEPSDASAKGVALTGLGLIILLASVAALLAWWFFSYGDSDQTPTRVISRDAVFSDLRSVQAPLMSKFGAVDAESLYENQKRMLHRYEWVDRKAGVARIPIDRAKQLYLEIQDRSDRGGVQ